MTPERRALIKEQIVAVLKDSDLYTDFYIPDEDAQAEAILDLLDRWLGDHDADVLRGAWREIHIQRFKHPRPDSFYNGILHAKSIILQMVDRAKPSQHAEVLGQETE